VAVAWLRELEDRDDEGNAVCTGRFECFLGERGGPVADGLPFEAAVTWAREHADRAYVDIEWERYMLLGEDRELPPLPPELAARVAGGPRRPQVDEWRDRPEDTPPMRWEVVVHLSPDNPWDADEAVVERVMTRLAGAGCAEVTCSRDELDAALADIDAQWKRAGEPEQFSWTTWHRLDFVLTAFAERAPTGPCSPGCASWCSRSWRPPRDASRMSGMPRTSSAAGAPRSTSIRPATSISHRCSDRP